MMTRMSSAITQLTFFRSADFGYFLAASAAVHLALSQPCTLVPPTSMSTDFDPAEWTVLNDSPSLVRKSCARSQSVNFDHGPTKMWKLHVDWSAVTVIGFAFWNASRSGLTKWVKPWNSGKYVIAAMAQPARMILSRPMRSDSHPKKMKNGVPMISDRPIRTYAEISSSFKVMSRKNRA